MLDLSQGPLHGALEAIDHAARDASTAANAEEEDITSIRAAADAIALPLRQLAREAESLASALKDASGVAGSQQGRIQDLAMSANALARNAARSTATLADIRVGAAVTAETMAPKATEQETATVTLIGRCGVKPAGGRRQEAGKGSD